MRKRELYSLIGSVIAPIVATAAAAVRVLVADNVQCTV